MDQSFDENDAIDLASVVAEIRDGSNGANIAVPNKNLSNVFDGCMGNDGGMKVYLRVRPIKAKEETIVVESDTTIVTNAPESSKRAQYTKTEARHYVSFILYVITTDIINFLFSSLFIRSFLEYLVQILCKMIFSSTQQDHYCVVS